MKRMASETRPTIPSTACWICARSTAVTLGKLSTTRRWKRARAAASSMRVRVRKVWGAPSSGPSGKTTKKFGSKRAHSTWRRLATRVATARPCTSQTISSPSPTPSSSATPLSSEMGNGGWPGPPAGRPRHAPFVHSPPATIFSEGVASSR